MEKLYTIVTDLAHSARSVQVLLHPTKQDILDQFYPTTPPITSSATLRTSKSHPTGGSLESNVKLVDSIQIVKPERTHKAGLGGSARSEATSNSNP